MDGSSARRENVSRFVGSLTAAARLIERVLNIGGPQALDGQNRCIPELGRSSPRLLLFRRSGTLGFPNARHLRDGDWSRAGGPLDGTSMVYPVQDHARRHQHRDGKW